MATVEPNNTYQPSQLARTDTPAVSDTLPVLLGSKTRVLPVFTPIDPPERRRTYIFPEGERLVYEGVKAICVRQGGGHRLELEDGRKVVIGCGWLAIELDVDGWSL
jgi:hypothetical protein